MNNHFLEVLPNGRIMGSQHSDEPIDRLPPAAPGTTVVHAPGAVQGNVFDYYWHNGALIKMPPRPTVFHEFDNDIKQWVDPRTPETQWAEVRLKRDRALSACDWVVARSMDLETPVPTEWRTYRQALRDLTAQENPFQIEWPTPPQPATPQGTML